MRFRNDELTILFLCYSGYIFSLNAADGSLVFSYSPGTLAANYFDIALYIDSNDNFYILCDYSPFKHEVVKYTITGSTISVDWTMREVYPAQMEEVLLPSPFLFLVSKEIYGSPHNARLSTFDYLGNFYAMKYINSDFWRASAITTTSSALFVAFNYVDSGNVDYWNEILRISHDLNTIEQYKIRLYFGEFPSSVYSVVFERIMAVDSDSLYGIGGSGGLE